MWYNFWAIVSFDAIFLILWIAVASVGYSCTGICNACGTGTFGIGATICSCYNGLSERGFDPDVDDPEIGENWNDVTRESVEKGIKDGVAIVEAYGPFLIALS